MGLKVELKAGERFILGDCLVTNGNQRTRLLIEGRGPDPARKRHHDHRRRPIRRPNASISRSS